MLDRIARTASILGHPLLTLPAASMLIAAQRGGDSAALRSMLLGFAAFAALVMGWSWRQVRRGRWAHVDASERPERRSLNRALLAAIAIGALLAWRGLPTPALALALALSAGIVAAAMLMDRVCKLSLHVAFAVYAAGLLWALGIGAVAAGLAFSAAVAWSRLRLSRHLPRDLVAGALAGAAAALAYRAGLAWMEAAA